MGYQVDSIKDKRKLISSFQDEEHLKVAWKSNVFVTEDKRMRTRAKVIYAFLDIETKVFNIKEFLQHANDNT